MKILYVHYKKPGYRPGGMEVHITSFVKAMRSLGQDIHVLPMLGNSGHEGQPAGHPQSRSIIRKQIARYGYIPRAFFRYPFRGLKLIRTIRSFRPDVLLVRYEAFEWSELLIAKFLQIPIVFEVNGTSFEIRQWKSSDIYVPPLVSKLEISVLNSSDGLIVVSDQLKQILIDNGTLERRITVNPNGADPAVFHPDICSSDMRRQLGLDGAIVVGYLGSFAKWHDLKTLLSIVPDVLLRNPKVRFLFAGGDVHDIPDDELKSNLSRFADRVVFTGQFPLSKAPDYLGAMDIALTLYADLQSFYMSALKLFEYMAAGKAIVATEIGQQGQLIQDGENGLLVPPEDVQNICSSLQRLIDNPALRQKLGRTARKAVLDNYTWTHNAQRVLQVCEKSLASAKTFTRR
jgi:glycosyltransferase involved in cell wall biosynthesis